MEILPRIFSNYLGRTDPRYPDVTQHRLVLRNRMARCLLANDQQGFICTGSDIGENNLYQCGIFRKRKPQSLETSITGFFDGCDVRKGSVKFVASGMGEGGMAVSHVQQFLGNCSLERRGYP